VLQEVSVGKTGMTNPETSKDDFFRFDIDTIYRSDGVSFQQCSRFRYERHKNWMC